MRPWQVLPLQVREDLGVMTMKEYSTFPRAPELEPYDQMQFTIIPRTPILWSILPLCRRYRQHWQAKIDPDISLFLHLPTAKRDEEILHPNPKARMKFSGHKKTSQFLKNHISQGNQFYSEWANKQLNFLSCSFFFCSIKTKTNKKTKTAPTGIIQAHNLS